MSKEQKIADIVCNRCMYGGSKCGYGVAPENCPTVEAILALIEQREKQMREALKNARGVIEIIVDKVKWESTREAVLKLIDAVLKEAQQ